MSTLITSLFLSAGRRLSAAAVSAAVIVSAYLLVAALWILLSGKAVTAFTLDATLVSQLELYKGWAFVVVTSLLLFLTLRRQFAITHEQEIRLRLFVAHAPAALAMFDQEMRYLMVSQRWRSDYGLEERDLHGCPPDDVLPGDPSQWREVNRRALSGETLRGEADRLVQADGSVHWLRWEARPWLSASGRIGGILIFTEDITASERAKEALRESESRLQQALECGRMGTWSWEFATGTLNVDEAFGRVFGRNAAGFSEGGLDFLLDCIHPDDRGRIADLAESALRNGTAFAAEYRIVHPDGRVIWIANRACIDGQESSCARRMIGACMDITPLKQFEAALSESESRFREVIETIREVFWISDVAKNRILYVSPGYEEIWGRPCADLYVSVRDWLEAIHPDDRERVRLASATGEMDGSYDETYRVVRPDNEIRWIHDRAYPVRDSTGTVVRIVGTAQDVTERHRLEEQFLHAQRLEAIGSLASGIAHDVNNILAPISMIAPMLKSKLTNPADERMLTIVERSAARGAHVIRQLLTFSRGTPGGRGPVQIRHLVKEMMGIMRETFPREIDITSDLPLDLPPVEGDATQLHQVLMNLCVNARDAMPTGGCLTIKLRKLSLNAEAVGKLGGTTPGSYVVMTISDTGHGIPAEISPRIFEPFFTTKEFGHGTGLGLSTVLGISKAHGGFASFESETHHGTSFHVYLPVAAGKLAPPTPGPGNHTPLGRSELVLFVDDESGVRMAAQHVLEQHGYRVLTAASGREGLGLFLSQSRSVRVVVTDLMMPEMGGIALIQALRELDPELPMLGVSGLDDAGKRQQLSELGVSEFLLKPFTPAELVAAIERELGKVPAEPDMMARA